MELKPIEATMVCAGDVEVDGSEITNALVLRAKADDFTTRAGTYYVVHESAWNRRASDEATKKAREKIGEAQRMFAIGKPDKAEICVNAAMFSLEDAALKEEA